MFRALAILVSFASASAFAPIGRSVRSTMKVRTSAMLNSFIASL